MQFRSAASYERLSSEGLGFQDLSLSHQPFVYNLVGQKHPFWTAYFGESLWLCGLIRFDFSVGCCRMHILGSGIGVARRRSPALIFSGAMRKDKAEPS